MQNDSLFFFHTLGDKIENSVEIIDGIYWGGEIETVRDMISLHQITPDQIRFFIGYSGWAAKQLDTELQRNSWVVANISADQLLKTKPTQMWDSVLHRLGGEYTYWPNFPDDPASN